LTRTDLQNLAHEKIAEAKILLDAGKWTGAYYLAGYAVECGLKACIAKLFRSDVFPEKSFSDKCYIHDLEKLVVLADLKTVRDADNTANPILADKWSIVSEWTEASRYDRKTQKEAEDLYEAITNPLHGVFPWLQARW
jgi:HEPN domain-containing protein